MDYINDEKNIFLPFLDQKCQNFLFDWRDIKIDKPAINHIIFLNY